MCCKKSNWFLVGLIVVLLSLAGWRVLSGKEATLAALDQKLSHIDQDPVHYVVAGQPTLTISPAEQAQLTQTFLDLYFSPWDEPPGSTAATAKILEKTQHDIQFFSNQLGWQFNTRPLSRQDFNPILANADLSGYPNVNRPAIVVHVTEAALFPSRLPHYGHPGGYPFNVWINSYLFPGTPVRILQQSKDRLWYFLKTASFYGWTPVQDVSVVSPDFITEWKKHPFAVVVRDDVPLFNHNNFVDATMRKGILYPMAGQQGQQVQILLPATGMNGNAQIQMRLANKADIQTFPIPATAPAIAAVAHSFIGGLYGWGDLYELRDCSSTTGDLLAGFGFWLPRNSTQQGRMGQVISLAGLSRKEKLKIFTEQAIPFFTIVHFSGHIALFLGMHNGQAYILQNVYGLAVFSMTGQRSQIILGRTIITPLDFSKGFRNFKYDQLDKADSISILKPDTYSNPQLIRQKTWQ